MGLLSITGLRVVGDNSNNGNITTTVSFANGNAIVEFDKTKTDIQEIEGAIAKTGYSVTVKKEIK